MTILEVIAEELRRNGINCTCDLHSNKYLYITILNSGNIVIGTVCDYHSQACFRRNRINGSWRNKLEYHELEVIVTTDYATATNIKIIDINDPNQDIIEEIIELFKDY